jgi:Tfp pilus assembly protein PilN
MIRINLAPTTRRRRPAFRLRLPSFNLGLLFAVLYLALVAGVGGYWWTLSSHEARLTVEIDQKARELNQLKATIGQGAKLKDQLADLQKRVKVIKRLVESQGRPIQLLDAFADAVPRDLWVTGMEEKGPVLRVSGSAFSTTAVSDFMANLRTSGKFKDVDLVVSRQDFGKTPSLVTFEVTCRFEG